MIKNFDSWAEYEGASEGSGRSDKIWLQNEETGKIGLFKFPKTDATTEHVSEHMAVEIAKIIGLPTARIEIGTYESRVGSMSHRINKDKEYIIEGIQLINKYYLDYDAEKLFDRKMNVYYSLEMILDAIKGYDLKKNIFKMMIFDFLIGNTDRHQNNWALLKSESEMTMCPLYDNGSSLCCYINEEQVKTYLGNDKMKFNSLVDSKSKSRIRIHSSDKREPRHIDVIAHLKENYHEDVKDFIDLIKEKINNEIIDGILNKYEESLLSKDRKILLKKYLLKKIELL